MEVQKGQNDSFNVTAEGEQLQPTIMNLYSIPFEHILWHC